MPLCQLFAATQNSVSAKTTLRGVLLGATLTVLCGCGENDNTAAVSGSSPAISEVVSNTRSDTDATQQASASALTARMEQLASKAPAPAKSVTVGSMGGSLRLDDRTGAIYSIELRDGSAFLQGLAVLRGKQRGWYNNNIQVTRQPLRNLGIGASLGEHLVIVSPRADTLWIDDNKEVSLADANVVLFEGASDALTQVGSLSIDSYLGPAPLDNARQRKALVQERLAGLLKNSATIAAAWSD